MAFEPCLQQQLHFFRQKEKRRSEALSSDAMSAGQRCRHGMNHPGMCGQNLRRSTQIASRNLESEVILRSLSFLFLSKSPPPSKSEFGSQIPAFRMPAAVGRSERRKARVQPHAFAVTPAGQPPFEGTRILLRLQNSNSSSQTLHGQPSAVRQKF